MLGLLEKQPEHQNQRCAQGEREWGIKTAQKQALTETGELCIITSKHTHTHKKTNNNNPPTTTHVSINGWHLLGLRCAKSYHLLITRSTSQMPMDNDGIYLMCLFQTMRSEILNSLGRTYCICSMESRIMVFPISRSHVCETAHVHQGLLDLSSPLLSSLTSQIRSLEHMAVGQWGSQGKSIDSSFPKTYYRDSISFNTNPWAWDKLKLSSVRDKHSRQITVA